MKNDEEKIQLIEFHQLTDHVEYKCHQRHRIAQKLFLNPLALFDK